MVLSEWKILKHTPWLVSNLCCLDTEITMFTAQFRRWKYDRKNIREAGG